MMKYSAFFLTFFALGACSSVLPKGAPPANYYTLNAPHVSAQENAARIPVSLQILMPQATPGLETERIALRKDRHQIDYYQDARWSGSLNALVQSLMVQSFDNTRRLDAVSNDLIPAKKDYGVLVEIQNFQIEYPNGKPRAVIRLNSKLIDGRDNHITASTACSDYEDAAGDTLHDLINAFDVGYQRVAACIVTHTLEQLEKRVGKKS